MAAPTITVNPRQLADNPVIVRFGSGVPATVIYRITVSSVLLYTGDVLLNTGSLTLDVDVSEVFNDLPDEVAIVSVVASIGLESSSTTFLLYPGGISKALARRLASMGQTPFTWKLKNSSTNFFRTTRSNSSTIRIPETELLPLSFYGAGMSFSIKSGNTQVLTYTNSGSGDFIDSVNIASLYQTYGSVNPTFTVHNGSTLITTIIVEKSEPTDYYIRFRNSLGAYEKIGIYGMLEYSPTVNREESLQAYDDAIHDFVPVVGAGNCVSEYRAETGYFDSYRRLFILDMLLARKAWMVMSGVEYAVTVEADNANLFTTSGEPVSVALKIKMLDTEQAYSPLDF